jgi:hypothetical protein
VSIVGVSMKCRVVHGMTVSGTSGDESPISEKLEAFTRQRPKIVYDVVGMASSGRTAAGCPSHGQPSGYSTKKPRLSPRFLDVC